MAVPHKNPDSAMPLSGKTILLTRAEHQNSKLAEILEKLGATTIAHPVIRIEAIDDERVRSRLRRLADYSMLAVLSRNGARALTGLLDAIPQGMPVIAIGPGTRLALEEKSIAVSACPEQANSRSLAETMIGVASAFDVSRPALIVRADRGSTELAKALEDAGVPFEELAIYKSEDVTSPAEEILELVAAGEVDWVTLTSSAIAQNTAALLGDAISQGGARLISISPTTTQAAERAGLGSIVTATTASLDGLVEALVEAERLP